MCTTSGVSSQTRRRRPGNSLRLRFLANFELVVCWRLFVSVVRVTLLGGRTRSLRNGWSTSFILWICAHGTVYSYYMLVPSSEWQPMIQNLQLQPLCSLILDRTINDPDKYQSGLTKIFFRAGMLAALESLRSDRLNSLVTTIQKNMKRKMAVKKYQELRHATIKIQTWWRGIMARKLVDGVRKTVAATKLQTALRRYAQRKRFLDTRQAIVRFQSRK